MEEKRFQRNLDLLDWYDALVFALAVLVLVFTFAARIVVVSGHSMEHTLQNGDRLLIQSTFYTPQRGDVVVLDGYINYGKPLVKRVIAKGGDLARPWTSRIPPSSPGWRATCPFRSPCRRVRFSSWAITASTPPTAVLPAWALSTSAIFWERCFCAFSH